MSTTDAEHTAAGQPEEETGNGENPTPEQPPAAAPPPPSAIAKPPEPSPEPSSPATDNSGDKTTEQKQVEEEATARKKAEEEALAELDKLERYGDEKIWVIGKPPEAGGKDEEWERYYQRPLGYIARMRLMALLAKTVTKAIEGGSTLEDLISEAQGLRGRKLTTEDLQDVGSVLPVVLRLVADVPDFLLDAYCILLDIPTGGERVWAKQVMEQPYLPDAGKWGLTDDQGVEIIEIALDQNYEPIREFFVGKLPRIAQRVRQKELARKSESES